MVAYTRPTWRFYLNPIAISPHKLHKTTLSFMIKMMSSAAKFPCLHNHIEQNETYKNALQNGNLKSVANDCTEYEAQIFLVTDYSMVQEYDSEQAVIDRITAVLNEVQSRYDDEFNASITFTIVDTYVSDCDTCD